MFRKIVFWLHLVCGVAAGVFVFAMSFTGAALTFEKDLISWAERDARQIDAAPADAKRLSLDTLLARLRAAQPDARVASVTVSVDPRTAVAFGVQGNKTLCVNPYTGDVREAQAPRMRAFMQYMRDWHTRLNFKPTPGQPSLGVRLNSAANVLFVFLGVSGLFIWWPRAWNWRVLRPSLWFNSEARGKARDWNWHNVIGFWTLPLILVLAGTGIVLSYQWAGDLVFRLAGETPPSNNPPPPRAATTPPANPPAAAPAAPTAPVLAPDALLAAAQKPFADWQLITLRFNPALGANSANPPAPKTFAVAIKTERQWPPFFTRTLTLDAATGEVKRTDSFAALSTGLRARRWIRLLHSGEAFGWFVQTLSGLACLGGCVLVYTGLALTWRRFFGRRTAE